MKHYQTHNTLQFVFWKIIFQLPRSLPRDHIFSLIFINIPVYKFTAFSIGNFLNVLYIKNTIYCIITIWNYRSINILSIFNLEIIIFIFERIVMFLSTTILIKLRNLLHSLTDIAYFTFFGIYYWFLICRHSSPNINTNYLIILYYK